MTTLRDIIEIVITGDGAKARSEFDKVGKSAATNLKSAQTSAEKMSATLTKVGVAAVGSGIVIGAALFKAAGAASEADVAQQKLLNTIHNAPQLVGATTAAFNKQSDALEKVGIFSHIQTTTIQAMLGQFKLTQSQILALTPLVEDFAAKFGIDTTAAAKAVGKAIEGVGGGLSRYIGTVNVSKTGTDNFDVVLNKLNSTVKGTNEAIGKTFTGQLTIAKNELKHVEEEVGAGAIPVIRQLGSIVGGAAHGFVSMDEKTGGAIGKITAYGAAALIAGGSISFVAGQVSKLGDLAADAATKLGLLSGEAAATSLALTPFGAVAVGAAALGAAIYGIGHSSSYSIGPVDDLNSAIVQNKLDVDAARISLDKWAATNIGPLLDNAGISVSQFTSAVENGGKEYSEMDKKLRNGNAAQQILAKILEKQRGSFLGAADAAKREAQAAKDNALAAKEAATSTERLDANVKSIRDGYLSLDQAMQGTINLQEKLNGDQRSYQGALLDVGDAQAQLSDAQKKYGADLKAGRQNSAQGQQDARDLARAWLTLSGNIDTAKTSIEQYAADKAHYDLNDPSKNGSAATNAYIGILKQLAATTTGPVRAGLEDVISHLHAVPSKKSIQMYLDDVAFNQALAADAAAINKTFGLHITAAAIGAPSTYGQSGGAASSGNSQIQVRDKGGWIEGAPGQPVPMIGHGGEYVLSRDMLRGAATPGLNLAHTRAGGGVTHIHKHEITVISIDPKQAGPAVIDAIKAYERNHTASWRAA